MKKSPVVALVLFLGACANTYNLPVEERSRSYNADYEMVWDTAVSSVDYADLALVETEKEHGRIRARAGASIFDLKGHLVLIVVRDLGDGWVRVDANAEMVTEENVVDFGRSNRLVKKYLRSLDEGMRGGR